MTRYIKIIIPVPVAVFALLALFFAHAFAFDMNVPFCEKEDDLRFIDDCFKLVDIPVHVKEALPKVLDKLWSETLWDKSSDLADDIEPTLQRFKLSRKYNLWVFGVYIEPENIRRIYLILENSRADIVMEKIHGIDLKWTIVDNDQYWNANFIEGKFLDVKDIDDDGVKEAIVQHRVYEGSRDNAAKLSYFKVIDDELENIFSYYVRELTASEIFITRDVKFIMKRDRIKFIDMVVSEKTSSGETNMVGSVRFTESDDKKRYLMSGSNLYDKKFDKELLHHGSVSR